MVFVSNLYLSYFNYNLKMSVLLKIYFIEINYNTLHLYYFILNKIIYIVYKVF